MRVDRKKSLAAFAIEIGTYSALVTGYFFLVLHLLAGRLKEVSDRSAVGYAFLSLALIVGQGVVLEVVTNILIKFIRSRLE